MVNAWMRRLARVIWDLYRSGSSLASRVLTTSRSLCRVEPFSDRYKAHAARKNIPLDYLKRMDPPMHLLCVHPEQVEFLSSDFKAQGFSNRQRLDLA